MSGTNIILLLTNVPIVVVAIYAGKYFLRFRKELRIFSWFLFLSVFIQVPSLVLYLFGINNMPLLHLYTLLGGFIIIHFYRVILLKYLSSGILDWVAKGYAIFIIVDTIFLENILTFNTIGLTVEATVVVILTLSTFNLLLQEKANFNDKQLIRGITWINSGFFIYFCSNLLLYYFGDYLVRSTITISAFRNVWLLHSLFSITMYISFFIGLWKSPKH